MGEEPLYIPLTFIAVVVTTLGFILYALKIASPGSKDFTPTVVSTFLIVILFVSALLAYTGFWKDFGNMPPRLPFFLFFEMVVIVSLFFFSKSREYIKMMPITTLTHIHIVRVPVEIVLWWLFQESIIDPILTFEGNNYDIIIGISAPFAGLFLVGLRSKSQFGAIVWHFIGMILLINIVYHAIVCTPYPFQKLCFETPNTFIFSFPYVWLPAFVVPVIMFCHIASIYKLFVDKDPDE